MFLTVIILINIIWDIYRPNSLKNSQGKNEGKILYRNKVSGSTKLISNFQDFLSFKAKKCFSIFLPINHPDVTISMGKKSTSL